MGWRDDPVIEQSSSSPRGSERPGSGQPAWQSDEILSDAPRINFDGPVETVRAAIGKLPEAQREGALRAWGDHFVAKERAGGGVGQFVSDRVRNMARGVQGLLPGSWLDEANAVTASGIHKITGGRAGAPYDETMAYQQATDRALDSEAAKVFRIPKTNVALRTVLLYRLPCLLAAHGVTPVNLQDEKDSIISTVHCTTLPDVTPKESDEATDAVEREVSGIYDALASSVAAIVDAKPSQSPL